MPDSQQTRSIDPKICSRDPEPIHEDEIPDALWENLNKCFPQAKTTLRKIRYHLLDCRSDSINASTALHLLIATLFLRLQNDLTRTSEPLPISELEQLKNFLLERFGIALEEEINSIVTSLHGQWTPQLQAAIKLGILFLKAFPIHQGNRDRSTHLQRDGYKPVETSIIDLGADSTQSTSFQQRSQEFSEFIDAIQPKLAAIEKQLLYFQQIEAQKIFFVAANQETTPKGPQLYDINNLASLIAKNLDSSCSTWWGRRVYTVPVGGWIIVILLILNLLLPGFNFLYTLANK